MKKTNLITVASCLLAVVLFGVLASYMVGCDCCYDCSRNGCCKPCCVDECCCDPCKCCPCCPGQKSECKDGKCCKTKAK